MKISGMFPSDYLKSDEVSGAGEQFTIKGMTQVQFKNRETDQMDTKHVLWFEETPKGLILNKTNAKRIAKVYGDDSDNWKGNVITLRLEEVDAFGEQVDAIRVKVEKKEAASV